MIGLFVYGTLKPGEINDSVYRETAFTAQRAIVIGRLYALPIGYPTLTAGKAPVKGVLLTFEDAAVLATLDQFERHCPKTFQIRYPDLPVAAYEYQRSRFAVTEMAGRSLGQAWVYTMTTEQVIQLGGLWLPAGEWSSQKQAEMFEDSQF